MSWAVAPVGNLQFRSTTHQRRGRPVCLPSRTGEHIGSPRQIFCETEPLPRAVREKELLDIYECYKDRRPLYWLRYSTQTTTVNFFGLRDTVGARGIPGFDAKDPRAMRQASPIPVYSLGAGSKERAFIRTIRRVILSQQP